MSYTKNDLIIFETGKREGYKQGIIAMKKAVMDATRKVQRTVDNGILFIDSERLDKEILKSANRLLRVTK